MFYDHVLYTQRTANSMSILTNAHGQMVLGNLYWRSLGTQPELIQQQLHDHKHCLKNAWLGTEMCDISRCSFNNRAAATFGIDVAAIAS